MKAVDAYEGGLWEIHLNATITFFLKIRLQFMADLFLPSWPL